MQSPPPQIADALRQLSQSDALRELESRLAAQNAFNLFDTIGVSNQELRHSDFLAFLLRPHEAHGLGDTFLKWFLGHALAHSPAPPISRDTLNQWDLSDAQVQREWNDIDLFITSPKNRLAVVIENKIYSGERDGQLKKYMETAEAKGYGGSSGTLIGIYLTLHGGKSSHDEYLPIGYEAVCAHLEMLCKTGAFARAANSDVETTIKHYTRMLRRRIVGDPEITKICRELYANHQAAFERIFAEVNSDTKPIQRDTTNQLRNWISNTAGYEVGVPHWYKGVSISHFRPESWANETALSSGGQTKWFVYLQTEIYSDGKAVISGIVAPCETALRTQILQTVRSLPQSTFFDAGNGYAAFYLHTLRDPYHKTETQNNSLLHDAWQEWVETEGPKFAALIQPGDFPAV